MSQVLDMLRELRAYAIEPGPDAPPELMPIQSTAPWALGDAAQRALGLLVTDAVKVVSDNPGVANLAILPVDTHNVTVRAQKGQTSPAVGWYGVYGEFPAWDVTLEQETELPARMDAVLFPLAPGVTAIPEVHRLRSDAQVTAFHIYGAGVDDTFILCEQGSGPIEPQCIAVAGQEISL